MANDPLSQGPVPWFDHHISVISDSYLNFFAERVKIEEAYVDSLFKLFHRSKAIDSLLDRVETSSTRLAWREVVGELEHEALTRSALISTLKTDVIVPLTAFRDTQERIRKRIREDVKDSYQSHHEMAENTLPRLKRTYLKRCQDLDEHKAQERAIEAQRQLLANPIGSPPQSTIYPSPNTTAPSGSLPVSPTPSLPSSVAGGSGSAPPRARSPSASAGLSDFAQQGKKQFGQLINFLNDRRDGRGGGGAEEKDKPSTNLKEMGIHVLPGSGTGSTPLKGAKARREAEEADKEYRRGVFDLETLRLRREKTLLAGYASLEELVRGSAETIKGVLGSYRDVLEVTATANASLARDLQRSTDMITPQKDASLVRAAVPSAVAKSMPKRVLYFNYSVGECNDLIFGVSLVDYATARGLPDGETPGLVKKCVEEVDARGLEVEGIYRVPGRHAAVQELRHRIERDEAKFQFTPNEDIHIVCALLKMYLRELPDPLFRFPLSERVQYSEKREEHISNGFLILKSKLRRLQPVHLATLRAVVEHLARVASMSVFNKMDAKNLAVIFGQVTFGEDEMPKNGDVLSMSLIKDTLMEDLINFAPLVFSEQTTAAPTRASSPPLPAAPENEIPAGIDSPYGTAYTKIDLPHIRSVDDFAPKLPPRPANSIHPARRAHTLNTHDHNAPALPPRQPDLKVVVPSPSDPSEDDGSQAEDDLTAVGEPRKPASGSPQSVPSGPSTTAESPSKTQATAESTSKAQTSPTKSLHSPAKSQRSTSPLIVSTALPSQSMPDASVESADTTPLTADSFKSTRTSFEDEVKDENETDAPQAS